VPVHHDETHGLFGGVIGGLDFRVSDEKKGYRSQGEWYYEGGTTFVG